MAIKNTFFTVRKLQSGTGLGLFECVRRAIDYVGIKEWENKLIGLGCDGTNANIADGGLKGHIQKAVPWIIVCWCLAHRLELSLKDALKSTFFSSVDELLLKVYFLYENSPKKCRELESVVEELRNCLQLSEMPRIGGSRPLRACGTRFVVHKAAALGRLVDKYGAYLCHLVAMTEDASIKSTDRQKLKGYLVKWRDAKFVIGCALFNDILKPAAILCKVLQQDDLCIVKAIECIFKVKISLDKLKSTAFAELATVKKTIARIQEEEDGTFTYQSAEITKYSLALEFFEANYTHLIERVEGCILQRLKSQPQELDVMRHALTVLSINGWQRSENPSFGYAALDHLCKWFCVPLEKADVDRSVIQEEWDDIFDYAKQYLDLIRDSYKVLWWKLFNSFDSKRWSNLLILVELLFCIPMANGRVERVFSHLKFIKSNQRTCLKENTLDELIRINVEGPPLAKWDASQAVELWSKEKHRRVNRKVPRVSSASSTVTLSDDDSESEESPRFSLEEWEDWIVSD